jgi:hypothetical protein
MMSGLKTIQMKIVIDGIVYDADTTPVVLVFGNDDERKHVAGHLANMPEKEGVRAYASYPEGLDGWQILNEAVGLAQQPVKVNANFPSNKTE